MRFYCPLGAALVAVLVGVVAGARAQQQHGHQHDSHVQATRDSGPAPGAAYFAGPSYPLSTCLVSGKPLDASTDPQRSMQTITHEGRVVKFCSKECVAKFEQKPQAYLAKLDEAVIKAQSASYPLETCPVSGQKLGAMGDPFDLVLGNRLVRLCCEGCVKKVRAEPQRFLDLVDRGVLKAQLDTYPLENCVVSGEALGEMGNAVNYIHGTTLVRLCCKSCIKEFEAAPEKFLSKLTDKVTRAKKSTETEAPKKASCGGCGG
ncbi:MAG: hypothetical protein AB1486_25395 [Planctomycetota bacterium]